MNFLNAKTMKRVQIKENFEMQNICQLPGIINAFPSLGIFLSKLRSDITQSNFRIL